MKKKNIIIVILIILLLISIFLGVFGFINKKNNTNNDLINNSSKNDNSNIEKGENTLNDLDDTNYKKVEISNLSSKLSNLSFENRTFDSASEVDFVSTNINIDFGIVNVSTIIEEEDNNIVRSYTVDGINDAVSVGAGVSVQGSGSVVFYILTASNKVYSIIDNIEDVKLNNDYIGLAKDMGVVNAEKIAVVYEDFNLSDNANITKPTVYIKTTNGKILTNENLLEGNEIVEVVEK